MAFDMATLDDDENLRRRIAEAVSNVELSTTGAWDNLDVLSTHTRVEGVDVEADAVILDANGNFRGVVDIYVSLQYGSDSEDDFTSSDSFLGEFRGHLDDNGRPIIDDVSVDTSDFYE
jgi:hypothetical protein